MNEPSFMFLSPVGERLGEGRLRQDKDTTRKPVNYGAITAGPSAKSGSYFGTAA